MRKAFLVLGPPRSGTSVISHIIHKLGVNFGRHERFVDPSVHKFNPIFFELQSLNDLNDDMFEYFSKKYTDFNWLPLNSNFDKLVINKFENKICSFIDFEFSESQFIGLKDPRFCFTLPIWRTVLERKGFDLHYVLVHRNTDAVYSSNITENKYTPATNFRIVAHSTVIAWQFLKNQKVMSVDYDALLTDPSSEIVKLCDVLGLDRTLCSHAESVVNGDLNHQSKPVQLQYSFFNNILNSRNVDYDTHLSYREIVVAAVADIEAKNQFLTQYLTDCDIRVEELGQTLVKRDRKVEELIETLVERDRKVEELIETLVERDRKVEELSRTLVERDRKAAELIQTLIEQERKTEELSLTLAEGDRKVVELSQTLFDRDRQIERLNKSVCVSSNLNEVQLNELNEHIKGLTQQTNEYKQSLSWRITEPLRVFGRKLCRITDDIKKVAVVIANIRFLPRLLSEISSKLILVEKQVKQLKSDDYFRQVVKERGISPEFLKVLISLGEIFVQLKQKWNSINLLSNISKAISAFVSGRSSETAKLSLTPIRFHLDQPEKLWKRVNPTFVISGWCVDIAQGVAGTVRIRIGGKVYRTHPKAREDVQRVFAAIREVPIEVGFSLVVEQSVGLHRMWVDVLTPEGVWIPCRRAIFFVLPIFDFLKRSKKITYKKWVVIDRKRLNDQLPEIKQHIQVMIDKPLFCVVLDVRLSLDGWMNTLSSLQKQIYSNYKIYLLNNHETNIPDPLRRNVTSLTDDHLKSIKNEEFVVFIQPGQLLSDNALYEFASAINQFPDIDLIYGDEDCINRKGERVNPFHKPDWSPDYLETFNYIGFTACFRGPIAASFFIRNTIYDFILKFTELTSRIQHIPKILGHSNLDSMNELMLREKCSMDITALEGRLTRTGRRGLVSEHTIHSGCYDIQLFLRHQPLVSIIIPTAGKTVTMGDHSIDLIANIVKQIDEISTYKNIEIIVVDNGDLAPVQVDYLNNKNVKRLTYAEPKFNISKKINLGATIASGDYYLLMNDDIEIISHSWIERMLEHFEKPHVGVVGGKLLYPDLRTQHVGVVHNYGNADHVRRFFPKDESGYYFSTCGVKNYLGVTGAVMMTKASTFSAVGGYTEKLAVSYNDIDFCLKVRELGFLSVYAPMVELIHMESISCTRTADVQELNWYADRWASMISIDPYYNEQFLSVAPPTFISSVNTRLI